MILKQISKGDNHYLKKQQPSPNLAGSIYARSSIKLLHLVPFGQQTWPPRLILFSDLLMLKKSFLL
jgi:hypothetical protein